MNIKYNSIELQRINELENITNNRDLLFFISITELELEIYQQSSNQKRIDYLKKIVNKIYELNKPAGIDFDEKKIIFDEYKENVF